VAVWYQTATNCTPDLPFVPNREGDSGGGVT
jgi:hypothetical protein